MNTISIGEGILTKGDGLPALLDALSPSQNVSFLSQPMARSPIFFYFTGNTSPPQIIASFAPTPSAHGGRSLR